jgi:hypothetical protein
VGGEATIFHFQPLFSIKRPSNATGLVLFVMSNMLSVHLWWWLGLSFWFLLFCPAAGRSPLRRFARSHLFFVPSSVLLPSYCLSSALAAINNQDTSLHVRLYIFIVGASWRGRCAGSAVHQARQKVTNESERLDAVEFCAGTTRFFFPSLDQKTTKCHRLTVACRDQCAGRQSLVLLLMPFDLTQREREIAVFLLRFALFLKSGRCVSLCPSVLLPSYCPSFQKQTRNFVAS